MGFRMRCRFCHCTEFGSTGAHRRHVSWHVSRGDAVVMVRADHSKPYLPTTPEPSLLARPEDVANLERQGWTRKTPTTEESHGL